LTGVANSAHPLLYTVIGIANVNEFQFLRGNFLRGESSWGVAGYCLHAVKVGVEAGCDVFLTNDNQLSNFPDITVEELP
jgi:hypothetical protein